MEQETRTFNCAHVNLTLFGTNIYLNDVLIVRLAGYNAARNKFDKLCNAIEAANIVPDETGEDTPCP